MNSLLGEVCWNWSDYFSQFGKGSAGTSEILDEVFSIISIVLWVVLGIVGAVGAVYAIYLGVQLARADEQGKRDDAKKHLITVFIAIGVTIALILIFNTFLPALISAFNKPEALSTGTTGGEGGEGGTGMLYPLLAMLRA